MRKFLFIYIHKTFDGDFYMNAAIQSRYIRDAYNEFYETHSSIDDVIINIIDLGGCK